MATAKCLTATSLVDLELAKARHIQVEEQGFAAPENYTIQFATLPRREAKTEVQAGRIVTIIDSRIHPKLVPSYIHHEFAHACQIAMGGPSASLFMDEASATLQEILALGEDGAWHESVREFQSRPQIPPFVDLHDGSKFEYGGALFLLFLEKRFGSGDGRFTRQLWSAAMPHIQQMDSLSWAHLIASLTTDLASLILDFAEFRLGYDGLKVFAVSSSHVRELKLDSADWPRPLGCLFVRIPSELNLRVEAEFPYAIREQDSSFAICNLDKEAFLRRDLSPKRVRIMFDPKG